MANELNPFATYSIPLTHVANHEASLTKDARIYENRSYAPNASDDAESVGFFRGAGYAIGAGLTNVAVSFANSGRAAYNIPVSPENEVDMLDTANVLRDYGATSAANFYEASRNSIDFTSELAAAFIPGTLAVKALKVAQKSNAAISTAKAAGGLPQFSDRIYGALDIFDTQGKKAAFALKAAKADAQAPIFKGYNFMRAGYSIAEGANESLVTTAAIAGALNQSSLFDDYSVGSFLRDAAFGTLLAAPLKALAIGGQVDKARTLAGIEYNQRNFVGGRSVLTPFDERISLRLQDLENVQDPAVKQRARTTISEDFSELIAGSADEKKAIYGAFKNFIEEVDGPTFDESLLGTKKIRFFDAAYANEADSVFMSTRTGEVRDFDSIVPTAGDAKAILRPGAVEITKPDGARASYPAAKFKSLKNLMEFPAAAVDAHALSVMQKLGENVRNFAADKAKLGDFKYALQGKDWTHLQAGYLRAMETGESIPFFFGDKVRAVGGDELKKLATDAKIGLVQEALNRKIAVGDIDTRFGVDTMKLLETDFAEGAFRYGSIQPNIVKRYLQPSHVVIERKPTPPGFLDREEFLGQYDVRAQQAARVDAYNASVGPVIRKYLDVEQYAQIDATKATMQTDTAKLLLPGGGGSYAGPQNAAEHNGTVLAKGSEKLKREILDSFVGPGGAIGGDIVRQAELSSAAAYVRANAAKLEFQLQADGTGVLFDSIAKLPLKNKVTGDAYTISKEVSPFIQQMVKENAKLVAIHNADVSATGKGKMLNPNILYVPPPNLDNYPYGAFVRSPSGQVRAIPAQTPEDLQEMMRVIREKNPNFEVNTIADIKRNQKLYKEYKEASFFDDPEFDFALARSGSFAPAIPRTDGTVVEDILQWYADRSTELLRRVSRNSQSAVFDELDFMGSAIADTQKTIGIAATGALRTGNPYHDITKTALNYSKYDEYIALKSVNQTVENLYSRSMGSFRIGVSDALTKGKYDAVKDQISAHMKATGQDFDYSTLSNIALANRKTATTQLSDDVNAANGAIATMALGLDFLHPIVNAIGFGVVGWPELRSLSMRLGGKAELDSALNLNIPGVAGARLPAPLKVMAGVIKDIWDPAKRSAMRAKYEGTVDSAVFENQDSIEELIKRISTGKPGAAREFVSKNIDAIKKRTVVAPNSWMQLMAHEVADRMVRAAGMKDEKLIGMMRSQFSKRVNGNYTASQRGALLQGPLGHAMGLFQTWTLGVAQNFMRYAENKETGNIAAFMTAQSAMFGVQSNPLFHALNSHLASRNTENEGLYQKYTDAGELGDFFLYGAPSAAFGMSLYTRGDITPHNPAILPTSLDQIPIVSATLKTYNAMAGAFKKQAEDADANGMSAFGNVGDNVMSAIALGSINRPLAGAAQVFNGYSQVSAGGIGGQVIDPDIQNLSSWTRVVGSRPLSEQKLLDAYYRRLDVEAKDQKRIKTIGAVITQRYAQGENPTSEELRNFSAEYISAGGNPRGVRQFLVSQITKSGPLGDKFYKQMHNEPEQEELRAILGAMEAPGE